ncbi:Uncharacterized protein Adt_35626 [Abeliophyllum distichum]|uniref:Uncharacterized protein n=1 Tax=Abeliophyllum distichum TaxID=126358 RepID=A0ABD1QF99_9LAMI
MSDTEEKMGQNDLERSEHLEDSDFNPKRQGKEIPDYSYDDDDDYGNGSARSFELDNDDEDITFFHEFWRTPIPRGFVRPKLEKYSGRSDPMNYLADYKTQMKLKNASPFI